jgi:hypothetical protein
MKDVSAFRCKGTRLGVRWTPDDASHDRNASRWVGSMSISTARGVQASPSGLVGHDGHT